MDSPRHISSDLSIYVNSSRKIGYPCKNLSIEYGWAKVFAAHLEVRFKSPTSLDPLA